MSVEADMCAEVKEASCDAAAERVGEVAKRNLEQ